MKTKLNPSSQTVTLFPVRLPNFDCTIKKILAGRKNILPAYFLESNINIMFNILITLAVSSPLGPFLFFTP